MRSVSGAVWVGMEALWLSVSVEHQSQRSFGMYLVYGCHSDCHSGCHTVCEEDSLELLSMQCVRDNVKDIP
jgi:hypothetical protein